MPAGSAPEVLRHPRTLVGYGGGLLESTHSGPQDRPTSNNEGSKTTTPIKNINLLNDRLEARKQGNRSRFKKYEVLIELLGFENRDRKSTRLNSSHRP